MNNYILITSASKVFSVLIVSGMFFTAFTNPSTAAARGPELIGEIDLDSEDEGDSHIIGGQIELAQDEKKDDPYKVSQDSAISYIDNIRKTIIKNSAGSSTQINPVSNSALKHLAGVYLYCSQKKGLCPYVLESILESDIINARIKNNTSCSNIKRFWKIWTSNNMQKSFEMNVSTAALKKRLDFQKRILPAYIRCSGTVESETADTTPNMTDGSYFTSRYKSPDKKAAVERTLRLLNFLKERVGNIYRAAGLSTKQ